MLIFLPEVKNEVKKILPKETTITTKRVIITKKVFEDYKKTSEEEQNSFEIKDVVIENNEKTTM